MHVANVRSGRRRQNRGLFWICADSWPVSPGWYYWLCWAPLSWAAQGWQPLAEKINKSEHDPRQYEAIKLANGMTVLVGVRCPGTEIAGGAGIAGWVTRRSEQPTGLGALSGAYGTDGLQTLPRAGEPVRIPEKHGGSHNASTASYRTAFYLEVENDALEPAVDRMADAIAEPLLDPGNADRERNAVNAELTMARSRDGMRMAQARKPLTRRIRARASPAVISIR